MHWRIRLLSLLVAGAAVAWIVLVLGISRLGSERRTDRSTPRDEQPSERGALEARPSLDSARVPIAPAAVAPLEPAAPRELAVQETEGREAGPREAGPSEWPPPRAFTARCRAPDGKCSAGCTELAGGRCLDPCFIHTAECSRDCLKPDGTCGFPPPDTE